MVVDGGYSEIASNRLLVELSRMINNSDENMSETVRDVIWFLVAVILSDKTQHGETITTQLNRSLTKDSDGQAIIHCISKSTQLPNRDMK